VVDPKDVAKYGKITTWHQEVLNKLMPGPVSFIVPNRKIPAYVNANMDSVSIGWQANWILMQLYRESGAPYVATSANPHGFPAPIVVEDAAAYFGDQIPIYIDNGRTKYGIPNAIVDLSKDPIQIVREGFNTFKDIEEMIAARVKIDRASAKPLGGD
ncbi:MAG: Sua5/YciO/YrdC/YwlC family protein, partial [Gallionellaceae bacterium]|nr:Sua5/YciO/YrdC/YwlC family protein [Gallionellaceae bacterium]